MSDQPKHTPESVTGDHREPWSLEETEWDVMLLAGEDEDWVAKCSGLRVATRIVACVNALAGIADPAAFVAEAKADAARVAELEAERVKLRSALNLIRYRCRGGERPTRDDMMTSHYCPEIACRVLGETSGPGWDALCKEDAMRKARREGGLDKENK